jgi:membrane protein
MLNSAMPTAVARMIADEVHRMADAAGAGFAIGGALLALWGASRGTAALMGALNTIFRKKETRPWWKRQLIAIACTGVLATLSLFALAILAAGPAGSAIAAEYGLGGAFDVTWSIGRWIGAGLLVMFIWALLYWWLPDTDAPFRIFTPGAIVGVLLWLGVTRLFGVYLDRFAEYQETYGALGGVIILLTWLWLSNMVLLLGAEINDVLADLRRHDSAAAAELAREETTKPKMAPSMTRMPSTSP